MADKKKLSTADILAAARKMDSGAGGEAKSEPAAETPAAELPAEKPAAAKPAAKPAASGGGRPSVSDILAMARAQGKPGDEAGEPAAKAPVAKPAAKPAAKAKPSKPAAAETAATGTIPRDTSSILAAARQAPKPGPVTKAEAAEKTKPSDGKAAKAKGAPPMPTRPDYAKPKPAKAAAEETDRRWFLAIMLGSALGTGFAAVAATMGMWSLALARFMFPNVLTEPPSTFKVGFPADYPPGSVENKFKAQFGVWIVNVEYNGQQQLAALKTVCTHLGCTPNWLEGEQKFKCPCHGSGFYKDGINFEGPAPRPLERYAIRMADDGQLEVDKSKTFQEEMGQWADSASYVTA